MTSCIIVIVINNGKALRNITDSNQLRQNDEECFHQIVILVKIINDAAPWLVCHLSRDLKVSGSNLDRVSLAATNALVK